MSGRIVCITIFELETLDLVRVLHRTARFTLRTRVDNCTQPKADKKKCKLHLALHKVTESADVLLFLRLLLLRVFQLQLPCEIIKSSELDPPFIQEREAGQSCIPKPELQFIDS